MTAAPPATVVADLLPWPRGSETGHVLADYVAGIGLRPEDCFGVVPAARSRRDGLVVVYRDSDTYRAKRAAWTSKVEGNAWSFAGVSFERIDVSAGLAAGLGRIFVHGLQWPGVRRVPGFRTPEEAFALYCDVVGLRPEDSYGFFPGVWDNDGDDNHWDDFFIAYRDRPEYADGRLRLSAMEGRHEVGEPMVYAGAPEAPAAPARSGPVRVQKVGWPRGKMLRLHGERAAEAIGAMVSGGDVLPEETIGLGSDRPADKLWLVTR